MPLIPLDECGNIDPVDDGCELLFGIGEAILDAALAGLAPYAPAEGSPCHPGLTSYVSMDQPPADQCDILAVYLGSLGPSSASLNLATRAAGLAPAPELEAHWTVELWEAAYPTITEQGDRFVLPDPAYLHMVNRHVYRHGIAMYQAVMDAFYGGTLLGRCRDLTMGPLLPAAPQGGCVGWRFAVTTGLT